MSIGFGKDIRYYSYYFKDKLATQLFFWSSFYLNNAGNRGKTPCRFLPHVFCFSTSSPKKIISVLPFPSSIVFRIYLGASCTIRAIIPGFKHCLSKGRGYLKFSPQACLLFAPKMSICARKNMLSMLYVEWSWANKAAWQKNDELSK